MKKILLIAFLLLIFFNNLVQSKEISPVHACDLQAAHPEDPNKAISDGIDFDFLNADQGIAACEEAILLFPNEPRFYFQLGRSYIKKEDYNSGIPYYKIATSYKYPIAYFFLGQISYFEEGNLKHDISDAIFYFKKALELDIFPEDSKLLLASSYYWNDNYDESIEIFLEIEQNQNYSIDDQILILHELGNSYYFLRNYKTSIKYYKKIIEKKLIDDTYLDTYLDTYAQILFRIAFSLDQLKENLEANIYYKKTIKLIEENNSADESILEVLLEIQSLAHYNLAFNYQEENRIEEAIQNLEKTIELNPSYANAYNNLANFYLFGEGVNQNFNKGNELLLKASNLEESSVVNNMLGLSYQYGEGFDQDFIKAKNYFIKSMEEETSLMSFINLGYLYEEGYGVKQSNEEALKIYKLGVKLFESKELYEFIDHGTENDYEFLLDKINYLESVLKNNKNVKQISDESNVNITSCESVEDFVNAGYDQSGSFNTCLNFAEKGNIDAQYYIGYFYENGFVVSKDHYKAAYWYKKAIAKEDVYSKYQYSLLLLNGYIKDENINLIKLFEEIENSEIENEYIKTEALYQKARAFKYGLHTKKDLDKALSIFKKIIDNSEIDKDIIDKAIDQSNEIKSIKAGLFVRNKLFNIFPIELKGNFTWENEEYSSIWSQVKFNSIQEIGPNRFTIKGSYISDLDTHVELTALLNTKLKSIEIWESNPTSDDPNFDPKYDFIINGSYVGFYSDNISEINAFWIPKNSGSRGALKLSNINNISEDESSEEAQKRKLNFGDYYAVVIGNNDYQNLEKLVTARIDATSVADVLENKYGFKVLKILIDATEKDIISTLFSINKKLNNWDNLLIYYAGHGYLDEETNRGYWLPVDADTIESQNSSAWISVDDISNILFKLNPKHILIVADSCYSGSLILQQRNANVSVSESSYNHFKQIISMKTRRAMTSGALQPVLDGGGEGHSVFASAFLKVLSKNNEVIDTTNIFTKINAIVSSNPLVTQTPLYNVVPKTGDEGGDFIFVPTN